MDIGTIYKEKKTNSCYICVDADERTAYLIDLCGNSVSGGLNEADYVAATDDDIIRDAKRNFQYILKEFN